MDETFFAPSEREDNGNIIANNQELANSEYINFILNSIPELAAILNKDRQIIFSNDSLLNFLGIFDKNGLLGLRPGEAVNCINSDLNKGGCGTSENCRYCGAVNAIMESQNTNKTVTKECRITTNNNGKHEYLDLRVTSAPFEFKGNYFSILTVDDISDHKRRLMLEKIFFHDIINLAGGLKGFVELLKDTKDPEDKDKYINVVDKISQEILEEIMAQRTLSSAEHNDLEVKLNPFYSLDILNEAVQYISHHAIARYKHIQINDTAVNIKFYTDDILLKRILINMLKNALEAIDKDSTVTLDVKTEPDSIIISVHNEGYISHEVQLQIFQRSYSTRGINRGLGTYSIKLLTERYLNGTVGFVSTFEKGTTFFVKLPIETI